MDSATTIFTTIVMAMIVLVLGLVCLAMFEKIVGMDNWITKTIKENEKVIWILKADKILFIVLLVGSVFARLLWGKVAGPVFFLSFGLLVVILKMISRID